MRLANVLKNTWPGESYKIERTKLKISTMTSVGDLEEFIFLHESVISFRSGVDQITFPNEGVNVRM